MGRSSVRGHRAVKVLETGFLAGLSRACMSVICRGLACLGLVCLGLAGQAQAALPQATEIAPYQAKLMTVYDIVASTPFTYDANEVESYGQRAMTLSGDERLYALWRVLYAYKNNQNEAKLQQWHDRIAALALKDGDSNLDLLARFMLQAYENETNNFATLTEREWTIYLTVPDHAIQNIVTLERERQFQYAANWAESIDIGDSLVNRLETEGTPAEGLLNVAQQTLAYNMMQVGDYNAYADHMLAMARLSRTNAFFLQKMDMLYDLALFAAEDNDVVLAERLQKLFAGYVRQYGVLDLRPWDAELCASVADKAENYSGVVDCLKNSAAVSGKIATAHDGFVLRLLTRAYARLGDAPHARYYLARFQAIPESIYPRDAFFDAYIEAWLKADEGHEKDAFRDLSDWSTAYGRRAESRRIVAVRDMYSALRKELDRKNAESALLAKQVQMGQLLLGAAGLIALLLAVIVVGGALWVVRMRRMQWHLKDAHEHAEAANAAKSRFLAVMSHELRTPLNGVLGMAQALKQENLSDSQREQVDILVDSGQTLLTLLNDVLDMSRIEAGKIELAPTPANMTDMVERVINTYSSLLNGKDVSLRYELTEGATETMAFDVLRVYQCLSNLVSNALKFTEKGSVKIIVRAEPLIPDGGFLVRCEVRDTGIGMSQATIDKLFDAYAQADAGTARKYGGSGLGLSISRRLSELMGGGLSVTSTEGEGSSFVMTFIADEVAHNPVEVAALAAVKVSDTRAELPGMHILLVDDHPVNRKVVRLFLEPFGFLITEAVDGQEALDADMSRFDLVLMDLNMPKMGGLEATRLFRAAEEAGKHVPIIALTADAMQDQVEACHAAGMDAHISKPILMDKLVETVTDMLRLHSGDDIDHAIANTIR